MTLGEKGRKPVANLLHRYPSLAAQRWELEQGHQRSGGAGQDRDSEQALCSKSHAGVQLLPPGSLSAETAVVEDAAQAWPPNYKVPCTRKIHTGKPKEGITHHL